MARQRRGGGFRPPELRGTLGTLLRTTLAQAGTLRDVLERGAREGRSRLDSALSDAKSSRRRTDALAELGDIVLDLVRRGEIDLDELPEARDIVAYLDDLDAGRDRDAPHDDEDDRGRPPAPARNRFDSRRRDTNRGRESDDDDGTVSSQTYARPRPSASSNATSRSGALKPPPRVWRPPVDDTATANDAPPARPDDEITARDRPRRTTEPTTPAHRRAAAAVKHEEPPATPSRPAKRGVKDPTRKGGIHFDEDDEDLADYMHPDDVPPKAPPDSDS